MIAAALWAVALGASPISPPLDGGAGRLDSGGGQAVGGAVATLYAGAAQGTDGGLDGAGGLGFLYQVSKPIQLGASLLDVRYGSGKPVVRPGHVVLASRFSAVRLRGLAAMISLGLPIAPLPDEPPPRAELRLVAAHAIGSFRLVANAVGAAGLDGEALGWGGAGLQVALPLDARMSFEGSYDSNLAWGGTASFMYPATSASDLRIDGSYTSDEGFGLRVYLILRNGPVPGRRPTDDRDRDGVVNEADMCPGVFGDGPDGCPPKVVATRCDCPLDEMSLGQIEELAADIADGFVLLRVGVRSSGDAWDDYDRTKAAIANTRAGLEAAGAPSKSFAIVPLEPYTGPGRPVFVVEHVTAEYSATVVAGTPLKPPDAPRSPK